MSGERTNVPSDDEILHDADPPQHPKIVAWTREQGWKRYEESFKRNRDDAVENGYDLICPVCGCAFNDSTEWNHDHDGPLHAVYDAIKAAT